MAKLIPLSDKTDESSNEEHLTSHGYKPKRVDINVVDHSSKIYVRKVTGLYQRIRTASLAALFGMFFGFVWIKVDGEPLIWFDLVERKFHLFTIVFWPQDFFLLALALIISAFGLFWITTLLGRIWCGYTCPQTAWTFVFMWLEEFFEGSRNARIKRDSKAWDSEKVARKAGKHGSWLLIAVLTGLTFVGYFYPIRELIADLVTLDANLGAVFWIGFFTVATYLNAGWVREKVCLHMCPYARFQSVMFNPSTSIIGYDVARGEPRGAKSKRKKETAEPQAPKGDCVDCKLCVQVCPTGIDIRDGLQYECIGCALCIDACDEVMTKLDMPKGLIRYASEKEFETGKKTSMWDARSIGYGAMMTAAVAAFCYVLVARTPVEFGIERERGALYFETGRGMIENNYVIKVLNKQPTAERLRLVWEDKTLSTSGETEWLFESGEQRVIPLSLITKPEQIESSTRSVEFTLVTVDGNEVRAEADTSFMGPVYRP